MKRVVLLLPVMLFFVAVLVGWAQAGSSPVRVATDVHGPFSFSCENGTKFSITFYNEANNYTASIKVNGEPTETLAIVPAATGSHYAGTRYTYDESHGESWLGNSLHAKMGTSCREERNRKWEVANCRPDNPSDEVVQDARCFAYFREVRAKRNAEAERREAEQARQRSAAASPHQRGNGQEIRGPGCMTIRVLHSTLVNITTTDDNGYTHTRSPQLQRLTVILDKSGDTPKDTALFSYAPPWAPLLTKGSTLDILCLGTNRNGTFSPTCPALAVGSVHDTPLMGAENPVYLQQQFMDGSFVGWQVLEICHGSQCAQVSSIHDRPTGTWR
jgi:membrane-bound inhibitor of C-type lysozyme